MLVGRGPRRSFGYFPIAGKVPRPAGRNLFSRSTTPFSISIIDCFIAPSSASHALGTFPPRGKACGRPRCAAPTASRRHSKAARPGGRPLQKQETGPAYHCGHAGALALTIEAREGNCSVENFSPLQAPCGAGWNRRKPLKFPRAGRSPLQQRDDPRNGGSRGTGGMEAGGLPNCRLRPPPGVFWFLFHVEKELAPQGETFSRALQPHFL